MRAVVAMMVGAGLLAAAPVQAQGSVDAEIAALTLRVQKLEGARAVKKLQRAFGFYVDRGLWDDAADLFTSNGTIEIGVDGVYVGKAHIRDYLKALHGGQDGLIYGLNLRRLRLHLRDIYVQRGILPATEIAPEK